MREELVSMTQMTTVTRRATVRGLRKKKIIIFIPRSNNETFPMQKGTQTASHNIFDVTLQQNYNICKYDEILIQ
jgi:hypothetical protein